MTRNIKWIEAPELGLAGKLYLPLVVQGLTTTVRHLSAALAGKTVTVSYPEEEPKIDNPLIYRGVHRLNKDEQGRVKCVACFLCATACPAHCIDIVAAESPWPDREKYPAELRDRRAAVHLLRHVRGSLSGGCDRADEPVQPDGAQPRGDGVRQGETAERLRRDEGPGTDAVGTAGGPV